VTASRFEIVAIPPARRADRLEPLRLPQLPFEPVLLGDVNDHRDVDRALALDAGSDSNVTSPSLSIRPEVRSEWGAAKRGARGPTRAGAAGPIAIGKEIGDTVTRRPMTSCGVRPKNSASLRLQSPRVPSAG